MERSYVVGELRVPRSGGGQTGETWLGLPALLLPLGDRGAHLEPICDPGDGEG
jgi:hypothetical protein